MAEIFTGFRRAASPFWPGSPRTTTRPASAPTAAPTRMMSPHHCEPWSSPSASIAATRPPRTSASSPAAASPWSGSPAILAARPTRLRTTRGSMPSSGPDPTTSAVYRPLSSASAAATSSQATASWGCDTRLDHYRAAVADDSSGHARTTCCSATWPAGRMRQPLPDHPGRYRPEARDMTSPDPSGTGGPSMPDLVMGDAHSPISPRSAHPRISG